tara:strand:- start:76 stop:489 length:414 start_codon:yes stop_codon:yes gene_type:complete
MTKPLQKVSFTTFLLLTIACSNISIDGSDVISEKRANEKFGFALRAILTNSDVSYAQFQPINPETPEDRLCERRVMYWKESVDACETMIYSLAGQEPMQIIDQYIIIRYFICDLQPVPLLNSTKPLQGEINYCGTFS